MQIPVSQTINRKASRAIVILIINNKIKAGGGVREVGGTKGNKWHVVYNPTRNSLQFNLQHFIRYMQCAGFTAFLPVTQNGD